MWQVDHLADGRRRPQCRKVRQGQRRHRDRPRGDVDQRFNWRDRSRDKSRERKFVLYKFDMTENKNFMARQIIAKKGALCERVA